ncbi:tRNAHis guanylyltransferase family protein [Tritrichomonas foetus]|uniref:tRNA(His) guanylyltransferase n=1 Tax=Tritrichomonas foetus TaxID=1144522 RepID=A0A1J4J5K3_9EUKA|nr:tRNAHis guanylyltransferase family protein [Tritrichomonas foetus]|eukprot:OHS94522.1 tRNAHis guanylyltransferase family protein [Tritrichomonas foetus]
MDLSRYQYLESYQSEETLLRDSYIVVRVDGRGFTAFCLRHKILRPIDDRLVNVMLDCARSVMKRFPDIAVCYGQSDEFSFVLNRNAQLFDRNRDKIISAVVSTFSCSFILCWSKYFPDIQLQYPPGFDARAVLYANFGLIRDYLSWRQADSHINCLYNYTLCVLMRTGIDGPEATLQLNGTISSQKHDILLKHGVDFNMLPLHHRRGTTLIRNHENIIETTEDMIPDAFWEKYKTFLKD